MLILPLLLRLLLLCGPDWTAPSPPRCWQTCPPPRTAESCPGSSACRLPQEVSGSHPPTHPRYAPCPNLISFLKRVPRPTWPARGMVLLGVTLLLHQSSSSSSRAVCLWWAAPEDAPAASCESPSLPFPLPSLSLPPSFSSIPSHRPRTALPCARTLQHMGAPCHARKETLTAPPQYRMGSEDVLFFTSFTLN